MMFKAYELIKNLSGTSIDLLKVEVSDFYTPPHYHSRNCAGMIQSGSLEISINGRRTRYNENQFFLIPSFTIHRCLVNMKSQVTYTALSFKDTEELAKIKDETDRFSKIEIDSILTLMDFALNYSGKKHNNFRPATELIINHILENYMEVLSLKDISSITGLSVSRIQHVFREDTGMSLKEFIIQERVRNSRDMILETELVDTAYECGFYDQSHFTRYFKKYTGITPSHYRRSTLRDS